MTKSNKNPCCTLLGVTNCRRASVSGHRRHFQPCASQRHLLKRRSFLTGGHSKSSSSSAFHSVVRRRHLRLVGLTHKRAEMNTSSYETATFSRALRQQMKNDVVFRSNQSHVQAPAMFIYEFSSFLAVLVQAQRSPIRKRRTADISAVENRSLYIAIRLRPENAEGKTMPCRSTPTGDQNIFPELPAH